MRAALASRIVQAAKYRNGLEMNTGDICERGTKDFSRYSIAMTGSCPDNSLSRDRGAKSAQTVTWSTPFSDHGGRIVSLHHESSLAEGSSPPTGEQKR